MKARERGFSVGSAASQFLYPSDWRLKLPRHLLSSVLAISKAPQRELILRRSFNFGHEGRPFSEMERIVRNAPCLIQRKAELQNQVAHDVLGASSQDTFCRFFLAHLA